MTTVEQEQVKAAGEALEEAVERALTSRWHQCAQGNFTTYWHATGWRVVVGRGPDAGHLRVSEPGEPGLRLDWLELDRLRSMLVSLRVPDLGGAS